MNILPFVIAMMMILSIMTYSKLNVFLGNSGIKKEFESSMIYQTVGHFNLAQKEKYDKYTSSAKKNNNDGFTKIKADRKPCLYTFFDRKERESHSPQFQALYKLIKNLMHHLYHKEPFFIEAQAKKGDIIDQILQEIIERGELPEYQGKIKSRHALCKIKFKDSELQQVFMQMLKGKTWEDDDDWDSEDENVSAPLFVSEHQSLLNFITVTSTNGTKIAPIRLWTTPKEILMAIFNDVQIVEELLENREQLRSALNKALRNSASISDQAAKKIFFDEAKKDLTAQFERLYKNKVPQEFTSFVNFDVNSTK